MMVAEVLSVYGGLKEVGLWRILAGALNWGCKLKGGGGDDGGRGIGGGGGGGGGKDGEGGVEISDIFFKI